MPPALGDASATLMRYGRPATSVFELLGYNEVDLTAAVGWTLANSPALMRLLLKQFGIDSSADEVAVTLESADENGRTDIELTGPTWKVIIEAKQGWLVPGESQLSQYVGRFDGFEQGLLVTMSDSSASWATHQLDSHVGGIPVQHEPWDTIRTLLKRKTGERYRSQERLWLDELENYMGRATSLRPYDEQWVYCVVVNDDPYGQRSFKDYVRNERAYFHPYGGRNGWPKRPLTLLAFRWQGHVQQVNRVESYEVVADLREVWPEITEGDAARPHIVYRLGPDIPIPEISTRGTYANARVWTLLDQLLTQPTLKRAADASRQLQNRLG